MKEYIEREAVRDLMEQVLGDKWKVQYAIDLLNEIPAADVVEVVRCRDCKYCYAGGDQVRFNLCLLNHNKVQSDDWYCADGKRRGEDT